MSTFSYKHDFKEKENYYIEWNIECWRKGNKRFNSLRYGPSQLREPGCFVHGTIQVLFFEWCIG